MTIKPDVISIHDCLARRKSRVLADIAKMRNALLEMETKMQKLEMRLPVSCSKCGESQKCFALVVSESCKPDHGRSQEEIGCGSG